jgi:hypothetical protein
VGRELRAVGFAWRRSWRDATSPAIGTRPGPTARIAHALLLAAGKAEVARAARPIEGLLLLQRHEPGAGGDACSSARGLGGTRGIANDTQPLGVDDLLAELHDPGSERFDGLPVGTVISRPNLRSRPAAQMRDPPSRGRSPRSRAQVPERRMQSAADAKKEVSDEINRTFNMFDAIVIIAIIVSLLGVINALATSVRERTREIGVLPALGASRWQVCSTRAR